MALYKEIRCCVSVEMRKRERNGDVMRKFSRGRPEAGKGRIGNEHKEREARRREKRI